jgi:hypothetical protein
MQRQLGQQRGVEFQQGLSWSVWRFCRRVDLHSTAQLFVLAWSF